MSTSATGTRSLVASLNTWSVDKTTDTFETTSFGATNKTYVQGLPDISGSFAGFWDDSETKPFAGANSADGVTLALYPDYTNSIGEYLLGPAWVSVSIECPVDGPVTISADFVANGAWSDTLAA